LPKSVKIVSYSISSQHDKLFQELKKSGYFPSKSAVVRYCINHTTIKLITDLRQLNEYIKNNEIVNVLNKLREFGYVIYRGKQKRKHIPILTVNHNNINEVIQ